MKVNKIELPKELTEQTALQFVGNIASVCTSNFNKFSLEQREKVGRKNLTESCGKPTRAFEMLPIIMGNTAPKHFQNMRQCLITERYFNNVIEHRIGLNKLCDVYNRDKKTFNVDFYIFHLRVPVMVRDHVRTHGTLSQLCESLRLGDANKEIEYWFPEIENIVVFDESEPKIKRAYDALISNNGKFFYEECTHIEFRYFMQKFYKRKEIYTRPLWHFVMGDMLVAGYQENWEHFCNLRTGKATQKETRFVAEKIKKLINE